MQQPRDESSEVPDNRPVVATGVESVAEAAPGRPSCVCWGSCERRGWDSNPRTFRSLDFKSSAFNRSATPPDGARKLNEALGCGQSVLSTTMRRVPPQSWA